MLPEFAAKIKESKMISQERGKAHFLLKDGTKRRSHQKGIENFRESMGASKSKHQSHLMGSPSQILIEDSEHQEVRSLPHQDD